MTRRPQAKKPLKIATLIFGLIMANPALSEPHHGIAMYGDPALPEGYASLPYVNPDAPQGGSITFAETGGFDSMNPYILKGRAPWGVQVHTVETLMGRSWDEPFTLYGLLAESIEVGPDRDWVEFTLRKEAAFSDGSPVTVEDVIWSFETLGTLGHPRYLNAWQKIAASEKTGERSVKFTFNTVDFELPLILGLRPILRKADWDVRRFDESSLDVVTGSGPYVVSDFEPNRYVIFKKNPNYWGRDLPLNRGQNNIGQIKYEYFTDSDVIFEAFKTGAISTHREWNAGRWEDSYNFPAIKEGKIVKSEIPHQRPTGIEGFVFNTRRDLFKDWRVRQALIYAFNNEFINKTINGTLQPKITSYFSNSVLGMSTGPAEGRVAELLEPFKDQLLPGALEGYSFPESDGAERNRPNLRRAKKMLAEAGWTVTNGGLTNAAGEPFSFDILLSAGSTENEAIANIYVDALSRLGIQTSITVVDSAQYKERSSVYDFDMTYYRRGVSLSPGNEQMLYWGSAGVEEPGSRNYMGMNSPAAEAMIQAMLSAESQEDFRASVKALDRILTSGRYVIPFWHSAVSRLAHKAELHYPKTIPMYGDWLGFLPDVWWVEEPK